MDVLFKRVDGGGNITSFVAEINGLPYEILPSDPLFITAYPDGLTAPLEPPFLSPSPEEVLAAERAQMVLTRLQFARQAALAGKMTAAEARAWAGAGTEPALVTAALALVADGTARDQASIIFAAAQSIDRNNALMPVVQAVAEWTDAQVDEFFRAGRLL